MEKAKKGFAVLFIILLAVMVMAVLDDLLDLNNETARAWADRRVDQNIAYIWGEENVETRENAYRENSYMSLQFEDFMVKNEFQYSGKKWNRPYADVAASWGYAVKLDVTESDISGMTCHSSEDTRILDDIYGDTLFFYISSGDFYNSSDLKAIGFRFSMETVEDCEAWFNSQYEKLVQLYGAEDGPVEFFYELDEQSITVVGYQWNAGETSMQLLLRTGGEKQPDVLIKLMTE